MRVRFVRDYRGWATSEVFYRAGAEAEVSDEIGAYLCGEVGAAEEVKPPRRKRKKDDADTDEDGE